MRGPLVVETSNEIRKTVFSFHDEFHYHLVIIPKYLHSRLINCCVKMALLGYSHNLYSDPQICMEIIAFNPSQWIIPSSGYLACQACLRVSITKVIVHLQNHGFFLIFRPLTQDWTHCPPCLLCLCRLCLGMGDLPHIL